MLCPDILNFRKYVYLVAKSNSHLLLESPRPAVHSHMKIQRNPYLERAWGLSHMDWRRSCDRHLPRGGGVMGMARRFRVHFSWSHHLFVNVLWFPFIPTAINQSAAHQYDKAAKPECSIFLTCFQMPRAIRKEKWLPTATVTSVLGELDSEEMSHYERIPQLSLTRWGKPSQHEQHYPWTLSNSLNCSGASYES